jgi:hypothetical protein
MAVRLDGLKARRILAGYSITELARRATCSDKTITTLENIGVVGGVGGSCDVVAAQRILDALAPPCAIATNSQQNPTVCTVSGGHGFQTGDTVTIAGVVGANADPNGVRIVTRLSPTTFSVPVNCLTAGGTGGTAVATLASVGVAQL